MPAGSRKSGGVPPMAGRPPGPASPDTPSSGDRAFRKPTTCAFRYREAGLALQLPGTTTPSADPKAHPTAHNPASRCPLTFRHPRGSKGWPWTPGQGSEVRGCRTRVWRPRGTGRGRVQPLACNVVDLAAVRGLQVTGQEADGGAEGVGVLQEGRDVPGQKDRLMTRSCQVVRPAGPPSRPRARTGSRQRGQRSAEPRRPARRPHLNSTPGMGKSGKLRMRRATSCSSGSAMAT
jgi:hypothetical protein